MPALAEHQAAFSAAILDPNLPMPEGLVGPDGLPSLRRFSVYRNNVVVGLINALKAAYPATCKIVGNEFFSAMARSFVAVSPPKTPIMLDYGAGFADFIAGFAPAAELPYLADVARIERGWVEAYHAADVSAFDPASLSHLPPEQFGQIRFVLAPSLRVLRSAFPALTIWRMNRADGEVVPVDFSSGGEDTLILRPGVEVEVRAMSPGTAAFLLGLRSGACVEQALRAAGQETEGFDLSALLGAMFEQGGFVGWTLQDQEGAEP
jgi:hypothetical protein